MNIFGFHICMDEIRAAMPILNFVGVFLAWVASMKLLRLKGGKK